MRLPQRDADAGNDDDDDDDAPGDDDNYDEGDIYIMVKCLYVTKVIISVFK